MTDGESNMEGKSDTAGGGESFPNRLYRAERGRTSAGGPFLKIIPTNPRGKHAGPRQIIACIYSIAAELERKSDEIQAHWDIQPQPHNSMVVMEMTAKCRPSVANELIEQVLAEMQIG
jgi:hypothetical protein